MIFIKDIIYGTITNPLTGELYEGLLYSVELEKSISILKNNGFVVEHYDFDRSSFTVKIEPKYPTDTDSNYFYGDIFDLQFSKLFKLSNNLGYFPTKIIYTSANGVKIVKYIGNEFRKIIKEEHPYSMSITFTKKYTNTIDRNKLPNKLYHLTDYKFINKIKQMGLKPNTKSKSLPHPERIYLAFSEEDIEILKFNMSEFIDKFLELVIDLDKLKNDIIFYEDPHFIGRGCYIHENIPKDAIIDYKTLS